MKKVFCMLLALLLLCTMAATSQAETTLSSEQKKLQTFLELTDTEGVKNGVKLNPNYDPNDPATWSGIEFSNGKLVYLNLNKAACVGALDLSLCKQLTNVNTRNSSITSLNLSYCSALTDLRCSECGDLNSLIVRSCTALETIYAENCNLTSIDLGSCKSLTCLHLDNSHLTELDLNNCTKLKELQINNNQISRLDLSKNTAIYILHTSNNPLVYLRVNPQGNYGTGAVFVSTEGLGYVNTRIGFEGFNDRFYYLKFGNGEALPGYEYAGWYCKNTKEYLEPNASTPLPYYKAYTYEIKYTMIEGYDTQLNKIGSFLALRDANGVQNGSKLDAGYVETDWHSWPGIYWSKYGFAIAIDFSQTADTSAEDRLIGTLDLTDSKVENVNIGFTNIDKLIVSDVTRELGMAGTDADLEGNIALSTFDCSYSMHAYRIICDLRLHTSLTAVGLGISSLEYNCYSGLDLRDNCFTTFTTTVGNNPYDFRGNPLTYLRDTYNSITFTADSGSFGAHFGYISEEYKSNIELTRHDDGIGAFLGWYADGVCIGTEDTVIISPIAHYQLVTAKYYLFSEDELAVRDFLSQYGQRLYGSAAWSLDDPTSWKGFTFDAEQYLTAVDFTGLTPTVGATLSLSGVRLTSLKANGMKLSNLTVQSCSVLTALDLTGNYLNVLSMDLTAAGYGVIELKADPCGRVGLLLNADGLTALAEERVNTQFVAFEGDLTADTAQLSLNKGSNATLTAKYTLAYVLGDADSNTRVNAADAACILRYTVKLQDLSAMQLLAADVTNDGKVGADDAAKLLRYTVSLIPLLDE